MYKISTVEIARKTLTKRASDSPYPDAAKYDVFNPADWERLLRAATDHFPSIPAAVPHGYSGPYGCPGQILRLWILGRSKPPITKIIAAAELLGCSEYDVAMAVHGFVSQDAAIRDRDDRKAERHRAWVKKKYATDPEFREKDRRHNEEKKARRRAHVLAGPAFTRAWMACAGHMKKEGVITDAELKFLKRVSRSRYRYRYRRRPEVREKEAVYNRGRRMPRLLKDIKNALDRMGRMVSDISRQLERSAKNYNRPWHKAGYRTREQWAKETPEGRLYQLEHWQVITHRRRAKQKQASGRGVTREQWFAIMKKWDYHCAYCGARRYASLPGGGKVKMTMDHVIPMPLGADEPENILPACHSCNSSKSGNDLLVWAATKGMNIHPEAARQYERLLDKYTDPTHATW